MKIGIIGSGNVGQALAKGLIANGHEVWLSSREPKGDKAKQLESELSGAKVTDFTTAAQTGELLIVAVTWSGAEEAIGSAGKANFAGKVVMDTSNIIAKEGEAMVYGGQGKSAAEQLQSWLPDSKVVKAFNTVGANLMYQPSFDAKPTMFIAGDDANAKQQITDVIVTPFGWEALDSGPLVASREIEAMALVWIRNTVTNGRDHAFKML